ncbi:hypothetical protein HH212_26735 (plasmid) [Massilia forsythiae]|uniref:Uncharacterized protein n=1 Tax=Massilia forsythiae TaxID=2728020 RepID=A0A7Z2W2I9_9BURK|nr:hypothetical protein [Massilia forsythiae]QJE03694.1 hypothetical protein HH212_26735 [Massilia forsythiae]
MRVLDPAVRDTLRRLGSTSTVDQVVAAACREQRRFFDALDAIAQRTPRAGAARHYLAELGMVPVAPAPRSNVDSAAPYYSFKIVGTGAALCIAEAQTRATRQYTVNVEGAVALAGAGPKAFDWPNKIVIQLTVQEAYQTLALLENKLPAVKFDGHGPKHDKSLHIEFQQSHYFARVFQRGRQAVAVPIRPVESIPFKSLLYKQLLRNESHLRIEDIKAMLDQMAAMASAR